MANYFLDASALVKYYVTEPGSTWVRRLIDTLLTAAKAEGLAVDNPFDHVSPQDTPTASSIS